MKKPLHVDGTGLGLEVLISDAQELGPKLAELANEGDSLAEYWIEKISKTMGLRENRDHRSFRRAENALLREVADLTRDVKRTTHLVLDGKRFAWKITSFEDMEDSFPSREAVVAGLVARLVNDGLLSRFRRCTLQDCGKWFFADKRAKWCSEACGSKARVRAKRKRDSQRGMDSHGGADW